MNSTIKHKTIMGVFWSFIERFGTQFILLLTQIVLARLLSPEDFGIIGMIIIFVTISQVFVDSGFVNALIQKKITDDVDYSTVFSFSLIVSIILYIILFFASPYIAEYLKQPSLKGLLRVVCLVLVFNSLGIVQFAKYRKELNFRTIAKATVFSNLLAAAGGITLALLDFGVWALAIQMVLIYFLRTSFFWLYSDWKPSLMFSWKSFKGLFNFGYNLLLSSLIDQIYRNVYLLIIGKLFTVRELGFYTQASRFQEVPVVSLSLVVGNVTFSAFSKMQDENERLLQGVRKTLKMLVFFNFPLMLGLAAVAHPLFLYILGEKWLEAVPIFQLLCVSGMLYTLHTTNLSVLQVKGRPDLFLRVELIKKAVAAVGIVIGLSWGLMGLIWAKVICSFISYFINAFYSGRLLNYPIRDQLRDLFPSMVLSLVMTAMILVLGELYKTSVALLLSQVIIGMGSYFLIAYLSKQEACMDGLKIIKQYIPIRQWKKKDYM